MWIGYGPQITPILLEEALAVEEFGLDGILVPEHHGLERWAPDPQLVAYTLGLKTSRIAVGTLPLLLPLYDPLRLAEQSAYMQQELDGRLIVGPGAGYTEEDFAHFGIPLSERGSRTDEGLQVLREAWTGRPFRFKGRHYDYDAQPCVPSPATPPPIWYCSGAPVGVRRAARLADALVLDSVRSRPETASLSALYRETCEELGRPGETVLIRRMWIGDPDVGLRHYRDALENYSRDVVKGADAPWLRDQWLAGEEREQTDPGAVLITGDPRECAEQLAGWARDLRVDRFVLKPPFILEAPDIGLVRDQLAAMAEMSSLLDSQSSEAAQA